MLGEFLHTSLVAEDRALGALRGGIDGEDGQASALLLQHMDAELIDARRLAGTWHTTDANADAVTTERQATVNDLLSLGLVIGVDTLDERDSLREDGDVTLEDALNHLSDGEFTPPESVALQIGVDNGGLLYPTVNLQTGIFAAIFGMFHTYFLFCLQFTVEYLAKPLQACRCNHL